VTNATAARDAAILAGETAAEAAGTSVMPAGNATAVTLAADGLTAAQ